MRKFILVFVGLFLLTGNTSALADYCDHLETEIDRMLKSLNGLTEFVNGNHLSLMQCNMDPELTFEHNRAECTHKYGSRGAWVDFESDTTIYVIFNKKYIRELAQNQNATNAMLDRSFKKAESIKNKIYWGGVIPSLRTEVNGWIDEYNRACTPIQLMQHVQPIRLKQPGSFPAIPNPSPPAPVPSRPVPAPFSAPLKMCFSADNWGKNTKRCRKNGCMSIPEKTERYCGSSDGRNKTCQAQTSCSPGVIPGHGYVPCRWYTRKVPGVRCEWRVIK